MADDKGLKAHIVYPDPEKALSAPVLPEVAIAFDASLQPRRRSLAALKAAHPTDLTANSVDEVCSGLGLVIRGTVEDETGAKKQVVIPVANENTFTPGGLTARCEPLFDLYTAHRTADQIATLSEEVELDQALSAIETLDAFERALAAVDAPSNDDVPDPASDDETSPNEQPGGM